MISCKLKLYAVCHHTKSDCTNRSHTGYKEKQNMMENQPAYGQEEEIDLVALTFTLLRKYRQILAAALACAIIFGAAAGAHTAWGGAVSQDAQKAYESELAEYNRKKRVTRPPNSSILSTLPTTKKPARYRIRHPESTGVR